MDSWVDGWLGGWTDGWWMDHDIIASFSQTYMTYSMKVEPEPLRLEILDGVGHSQ